MAQKKVSHIISHPIFQRKKTIRVSGVCKFIHIGLGEILIFIANVLRRVDVLYFGFEL